MGRGSPKKDACVSFEVPQTVPPPTGLANIRHASRLDAERKASMIDEQGDLSLVLSPFQFTIGQLVRAIIVSGVVFWLMRMLGGPALLAAFPAIDSLIRARTKPSMSIGWSTLCRCLVLVAFGTVYCMYYYLTSERGELVAGGITFGIFALLIIVPVVPALMHHGYKMPAMDDKFGPIAWDGFSDRPEPAAAIAQAEEGLLHR